MIRKAREEDIPAILGCFEKAKEYMRSKGNLSQWINGYPGEEVVRNDIAAGNCYVLEKDGCLTGVFTFIQGIEPTYKVIEEGAWHMDKPYGTIHRIASCGVENDITGQSFAYCEALCPYLRVDTHADNIPMQNAIKRYGFEQCGIIYVADGSPRLAYDFYRK